MSSPYQPGFDTQVDRQEIPKTIDLFNRGDEHLSRPVDRVIENVPEGKNSSYENLLEHLGRELKTWF
jgi:hypothetical protein